MISGTQPLILDTASEPGRVMLELQVPQQLHYFQGHFPRHPILPGVVQLAWAASLGRDYLQADGELLRLESIKFSRIVRPEARMSLLLQWSQPQRQLSFRYTENGAPCSSGRFVFAA